MSCSFAAAPISQHFLFLLLAIPSTNLQKAFSSTFAPPPIFVPRFNTLAVNEYHLPVAPERAELPPAPASSSRTRAKARINKNASPANPVAQAEVVTPAHPLNEALLKAIRLWRKKDNRLWSDVEAEELPKTFFYNLHQAEWKEKSSLAQSLLSYFHHPDRLQSSILEVGCGCGWLSAALAKNHDGPVNGLDIDGVSINQAKKLFQAKNLRFVEANFFDPAMPQASFDQLIVMDALMWFPSIPQVIDQAIKYLRPGGEIHFLHHAFLPEKQLASAREKLQGYFQEKQMEAAFDQVHLHSQQELAAYPFERMIRPSWWGGLMRPQQESPWLRLKLQ